MGMFNITRWKRENKNTREGSYTLNPGFSKSFETGITTFRTKRRQTKDNWIGYRTCQLCKHTIEKGDKYLKHSYEKFCHNCAKKILPEIINSITDFKKKLQKTQKVLEENQEQWDKELVVNRI